jgi:hypothetical protein
MGTMDRPACNPNLGSHHRRGGSAAPEARAAVVAALRDLDAENARERPAAVANGKLLELEATHGAV